MLSREKYQSRSLDDLRLSRRRRSTSNDEPVSNTTRTEADLTSIGCEDQSDERVSTSSSSPPRPQSRSAPVSPTQLDDRDLLGFLRNEQDHFVYNVDLSDEKSSSRQRTHFDVSEGDTQICQDSSCPSSIAA